VDMVERNKKQSQSVTLEQLLQVKRSERPEPEFWDRFDRELHQKQLSALVQAAPWYLRLGRIVGRLARRSAPVTAAAAAVAAGYFAVSGPTTLVKAPSEGETVGRYETIRIRPSEATAVASVENLPELVVPAAATWSEPVTAPAQPVRAEARYVMDVMAKDDRPVRYVTLSNPKTLLASGSPEGTYVVNALSTRNAYPLPASRGVAQF
jgi:hypothetical protein